MARPPENDYPDEIISDREMEPLSANQAKLPTVFFIIAAAAGLLILIGLQLFGGNNNNSGQVAERPVFTPPIDTTAQITRPRIPDPEPVIEDDFDDDDDFNTLNVLEIERLRQLALLNEQKMKLQEAQRQAEEAERDRRLKSSMLLVDNGGSALSSSTGGEFTNGAGPNNGFLGFEPDANENNDIISNKNERFLRDASVEQVVSAQAVKLADQDWLITQGTFISGVTETMINSDLPGLARAIVDKPVYGRTGKYVVVPKGSRLIGRYRSGIDIGQSRVYIVWSRLERPDGVVIDLGSPGTDPIGQAGMGGKVDKHFFERFGTSALFSAIGPTLSALLDDGNQSVNQREIIESTRDSAESSAEIILRQSMNIPPTIRVPQGTELTIFVNRDLSFSAVK